MFEWEYEDPLDEYEAMKLTSPVIEGVDILLKRGGHDEIETLKIALMVQVKLNQNLTYQLQKYEAVRPRLFRMPDGNLTRWDAPDDLIEQFVGIENEK